MEYSKLSPAALEKELISKQTEYNKVKEKLLDFTLPRDTTDALHKTKNELEADITAIKIALSQKAGTYPLQPGRREPISFEL